MPTVNASFSRDANHVPITTDGLMVTTSQTLSGNATTVTTPIFTIIGVVEIRALWGIVTTDFGANHTVAYYRLNDQTVQNDITLATGSTLSSFKSGSIIYRRGLSSAAAIASSSASGKTLETTTSVQIFSPIILVKKNGALTQIEYVYTTTDTPTTGVIQHNLRFLPLSADANIIPV